MNLHQPKQLIRLNKFIASRSEFSRRKADELIKNGHIQVNNKIIRELGTTIDPQKDQVKINNKLIAAESEKIYLALNKPQGYITTRDDEFERKTVMELLPKIPNLKPVGRLDQDTEGLLLLSNDGDFINKLTHPKFECEKEYFLKVKGSIESQTKEKLEKGIKVEGKKTLPSRIKIIRTSPQQTDLTITIREGRKRQIRKMFASLNYPVKYLQRIRIGHLHLGSLPKGSYRYLTKNEVNAY